MNFRNTFHAFSFLLFTIFLFPVSLRAQVHSILDNSEYRILYTYTFQSDSTDSDSKKEVVTELLIANNLSSFHSINKYQRDSAFLKSTFKTGIAKSFGSIDETNFEVHKRPDKTTVYETIDGSHLNIGNEIYVYQEIPFDFNWDILTDTATIHGLFCQMAQTSYAGRTWTAWFTTSIPITDGPYKFCGLPGLIVSIYDQDRYFQFDIASIDRVKKSIFVQENLRPDLNLIYTTRKEFIKQRQFYKDNMVEIAISSGFELAEKDKRSIKDEVKKQNNAIDKQ